MGMDMDKLQNANCKMKKPTADAPLGHSMLCPGGSYLVMVEGSEDIPKASK